MPRFAVYGLLASLMMVTAAPGWADEAKDKPMKADDPAPPGPIGRYQSMLIPQSELKGAVVPPVLIIFDTATGVTKACGITQTYTGASRFSLNC